MSRRTRRPRTRFLVFVLMVMVATLTVVAFQKQTTVSPEARLIAGFKKTYPASVSDAVELVTGRTARWGTTCNW